MYSYIICPIYNKKVSKSLHCNKTFHSFYVHNVHSFHHNYVGRFLYKLNFYIHVKFLLTYVSILLYRMSCIGTVQKPLSDSKDVTLADITFT